MSLLPRGHAAFKTGSQIGLASRMESVDDLLPDDICHLHFVLRRHSVGSASYYSINCAEP